MLAEVGGVPAATGIAGVEQVRVTGRVGARVRPARNAYDRLGHVIVSAATPPRWTVSWTPPPPPYGWRSRTSRPAVTRPVPEPRRAGDGRVAPTAYERRLLVDRGPSRGGPPGAFVVRWRGGRAFRPRCGAVRPGVPDRPAPCRRHR
ncbi:hypothetical protein NKH18_39680 [Streptomyces sp. M10(2022)]